MDKHLSTNIVSSLFDTEWTKIEGHITPKREYKSVGVELGNSKRRVIKMKRRTVIIDSVPND